MESCASESQAALVALSQGENLSKQDVVTILLMLRHNTRLLYQSSHAGRQQIYRARAAFDSTYLEKDACVYERKYLEEEINRCISTKYSFTSLIEQPDEALIEEQLNKELCSREAAIKEKQEMLLRKHVLLQSLQERYKKLEELGRLLSTMFEGAKVLGEVVEYQVGFTRPNVLANLYSKLKHLLSSQEGQYELRYFAAQEETEEENKSRIDDLSRLTLTEHISLAVLSGELVLSFVMTEEHLVSLQLHSTHFTNSSQSESWYLQLPLEGSFLLTIPCENGFALRWVNALASVLPDPSFKDGDITTILSVILFAFNYRRTILALLPGAKIDESDVNHVIFEHGSLRIRHRLGCTAYL